MVRISEHEVKVYRVVTDATRWLSVRDIAQRADVIERTARLLARRLATLGVFQEVHLADGNHYRAHQMVISEAGKERVGLIEQAQRVLAETGR
jgi:hypothetical protein